MAIIQYGQIESLIALDFFQLQQLIDEHPEAVFAVEDVEANLPIFNRRLSPRKNLKVAQDVGRVKGVARLIFDYLVQKNRRFVRVKPLTGHLKKAKKDSDYFNRLTGWEKSSNADKRDAALVALYGIRPGQIIPKPSEVPH